MARTTSTQRRQWRGPAVLSFGFRPLFLLAALWAAGAMAVWSAMLAGMFTLPSRFDPVTWHAHEFLLGYLGAVIGGFLLTAVPNWTGRLPVVGWRLGGLCALWLVGRLAIAVSAYLPGWGVAGADLIFFVVLAVVILREIVAGRNWRNLPVLILLTLLILSNALFHLDAGQGGYAAGGIGLRLGLATVLVLIVLIGGRIIPSFTRNWLVKRGATALPTPPMQRFDKAAIGLTVAVLIGWCVAPGHPLAGVGLLILSVVHLVRFARWRAERTLVEPLVWILHVAYACIPLGALAMGLAILVPSFISQASALHVWTVGAIGLMTVAVMTRATKGHVGRPLVAGRPTVAIYLVLIGSVISRPAADLVPQMRDVFLTVSATLWIACFAGFVVVYGPMLLRTKQEPAS
ncbi:NnrS family protein [uncultured Sulfitobacter sp.]|uniref:NnrS family protein n=1 Tax=uncultured Sulfitobacter sp. TaxID=191468 RepID=UPI002615AC5E|nr:NnrS family protein [uncultured Sulfitobacter sp.]